MKYRRIGIDLDNTIIDYRKPLLALASKLGLTGISRGEIREELRKNPLGERVWQEIQAELYTNGLAEASLSSGVFELLETCRLEGIDLFVVSHKTVFALGGEVSLPLREAAVGFLLRKRVIPKFLPRENLFFASSRDAKLAIIRQLQLDAFVDDLPEVLLDEGFPTQTQAILYDESGQHNVFGVTTISNLGGLLKYTLESDEF